MKKLNIFIAAQAAFPALVSAPLWASEMPAPDAHGAVEAAAHGAAQAGKASLPQLDVTLYPGFLFWLGLSFLALFLVMRFAGVPALLGAREKRQALLDAELEAARAASQEAQNVRQAYEDALHEARIKAQDAVSSIIRHAADDATHAREKQQQDLSHRMVVAEQNIADARQQAMQETPKFINDLVMGIVAKVTSVPGAAA